MRLALVSSCAVVHLLFSQYAVGAVEPIIETFNGDGDYATVDGSVVGLDNPDWRSVGDGELRDGGIAMENQGPVVFETESDELFRPVVGLGSFVERIEIDNLFLGELCDFPCEDPSPPGSQSKIGFRRTMDLDADGFNAIQLTLGESMSTPDGRWDISIFVPGSHVPGESNFRAEVDRGTHVAIELRYDESSSATTIVFDHDLEDEVPGVLFGPFSYVGPLSQMSETRLEFYAIAGGVSNGVVDFWSVLPFSNTVGDFNGDGIIDAADIDQLSEQVRAATNNPLYDLNDDALVNDLDRRVWVHDLKHTYFGDADLNGSFDSADLVQVLAAGEYEDDVELNSTWLTGDWDGDGDFTSGDLVTALADGGYETAAAAAAVPEPSGALLMVLGIAAMTMRKGGKHSVLD